MESRKSLRNTFFVLPSASYIRNFKTINLKQQPNEKRFTSPLINKGFLPSSIRTESTSSTIAKWKGFGLYSTYRRKILKLKLIRDNPQGPQSKRSTISSQVVHYCQQDYLVDNQNQVPKVTIKRKMHRRNKNTSLMRQYHQLAKTIKKTSKMHGEKLEIN